MAAPQKIKAQLIKIDKYADNISYYTFQTEKETKFRAGQFLHLSIDDYDPSTNWPESRVFSIANSPQKKNIIEILVSHKGKFTQRMLEKLKEYDYVWLKLPYGSFNFNEATNNDCIFIAGGTGISPFLSFLNLILESKIYICSIRLYYGVRIIDLIIFKQLFEKIKNNIKDFTYTIYVENLLKESENIFKGILPVAEIINETIKLQKPIYYLSGPPDMIKSFNSELINKNFNTNDIYYDKWE